MTTSVKNDDNQFDWKLYGYLMGLKAAKRRDLAKKVQEYKELLPDEPSLGF